MKVRRDVDSFVMPDFEECMVVGVMSSSLDPDFTDLPPDFEECVVVNVQRSVAGGDTCKERRILGMSTLSTEDSSFKGGLVSKSLDSLALFFALTLASMKQTFTQTAANTNCLGSNPQRNHIFPTISC